MSTTDLAQQVADLTTATTKLTQEVVGQKDRLTAAADTATGKSGAAAGSAQAAAQSVTDAAAEVTKATNQANTAEAEADRAKTEADKAKQVSGLDTVEQAVDMAMSEFAGLMTESEARAIQWRNLEHFGASGMVDMGKAYKYGSPGSGIINSGMFTWGSTAFVNSLGIGAHKGIDDKYIVGETKTYSPVTHIAGAVSNILGIDPHANWTSNRFLLPEAEDGTRIYDSTGNARGSGKASLDLKNEIDPKYGNAPTGTEAEILREAVGRVFEGDVKNGDFRLGDNGDWGYLSERGTMVISEGKMVSTATVDNSARATSPVGFDGSSTYKVTLDFESVSHDIEINQGYTRSVATVPSGHEGIFEFEFTSDTFAGNSQNISIYHQVVGSEFILRSVQVRKVTEEVVTHPVDLVGLEYYEEELTGRQEIFECIQSLSTTFGTTSVPTVLSTRKLSYFQQYDGQFPEVTADPDYINDRYRCVVWDDLTEPQKREVAAYMGEKLFVGVNGNIVNGRLRARTIRGAGNGDWYNTNAVNSEVNDFSQYLAFTNKNYGIVLPQGDSDEVVTFGSSTDGYTCSATRKQETAQGVFFIPDNSPLINAYQGRCFFYVVASVPRANQGAYHPSLNPWGTANVETLQETGSHHWYLAPDPVKTEADCFTRSREGTGYIGTVSGHPDDIFYDGIEAGGLNGVIDWRLGAVANDSPEEAAKVEAKVENGTYRGLEKLVKFAPIDIANRILFYSSPATHAVIYGNSFIGRKGFELGDAIWYQGVDNSSIWYSAKVTHVTSTFIRVDTAGVSDLVPADNGETTGTQQATNYWASQETNLSVSGEFNHTDVVGDPASILATPELAEGWLGNWIPVIPDGTAEFYTLTRKSLSTDNRRIFTVDSGNTWVESGYTFDSIKNGFGLTVNSAYVAIYPYTAFAKQTKPSTNKPVYNVRAGLMDVLEVMTNSTSYAALLSESFFGKILTSSAPKNVYSSAINKFLLDSAGKLSSHSNFPPEHTRLSLGAPNNNSQAFKALPYQISNNGQGSIGYQANELTWDASKVGATKLTTTINQLYRGDVVTLPSSVGFNYTSQELDGKPVQALRDFNTYAGVLSNYFLDREGNIRNKVDGSVSGDFVLFSGNGWGDDSAIKVTTDGSDTFVDLNGNTNLSVVHELAIPYTWTSNHARAGQQVEGVDL